VLRFLAEDVGKELATVLDVILRALSAGSQEQKPSLSSSYGGAVNETAHTRTSVTRMVPGSSGRARRPPVFPWECYPEVSDIVRWQN
jgi:hypothetical protein